ncbi:hypothetical protein KJ780_05095 [Candidatus Micrarchaeota archaeon]|nr:hypothetical protein [Candidatus Micrarchaeota archaeon]
MVPKRTLLAFLILLSSAYSLTILEPISNEIKNGDELFLGEIGPGQTISISIDGRPTTGGIQGLGGAYDLAYANELPEDWSATPSDPLGKILQVKITSAKNAKDGEYRVRIDVLDEGDREQLGNVTFYIVLKITHNVFSVEADKNSAEALSGQPARFYLTITNKVNTGDVFSITSSSQSNAGYTKYVYVPPKSSKTLVYEFVSNEEEEFSPQIYISSRSSENVNATLNMNVKVHSSLPADYKATNNGLLFFPIMNGIFYALAGLISNLM